MAYTKTWVETDPIGSQITVSELDNWIRDTKIAIRERLELDGTLGGLFEVGSFAATGAMPAKGTGRFHADLFSNLGSKNRQDGRGFFTTDSNSDANPRLFHLETSGAREIAYLNRNGSRTMVGPLFIDIPPIAVPSSAFDGAKIHLQTAADAAVVISTAVGLRVMTPNKGAGSFIGTLVGIFVESQGQGNTNNYAIQTVDGRVSFDGVFDKYDGGDVTIGTGNVPTNAQQGWIYICSNTGTPTGTPSGGRTGYVPLYYDRTNNRLYVYNSGWKSVVLA
jgi:hypothetical protein